ncbi:MULTISPECIES: DMT family transporter [Marinobacter]|uniref:DMT family transporter n=1 Tax=Marinobacter TaxID=2742 RepID=UPI00126827D8|nr:MULTISPECIES: DMT family transporter [Marinobacter]MCD1631771.1 DMT family transporter [Marinobacter shengliensis]QFS88911.1 putative amino-acid metabolite efflux pump [Marinobacter sp. THAF197a]QFT52696.1 putative amino-acid metabolite efflux pump [Marinobacter sp. THAF39]
MSSANSGILSRIPGLAYVGLVLTPLFWAGNAVVARGTVEHVPPLSMSFWRWVIALAILLPFGFPGMWHHRRVIRARLGSMLALATFSVAAFNSLLYYAAITTTATNIALINATIPIFVALLAWMLLGDRTRPVQALGIALAIGGILTVVARGELSVLTGLQAQPGDLIMVAAVFSWGLFSVLLRRQAVPLPALTFLTTQILLGTLVILPFYLVDLFFFAGGFELTRNTAMSLLYFAIFPGILAYAFWNHGVHAIGPARAAIFMYLTPVFASILAGIFLGESLGAFHMIGGLLILAGLVLATRTGRRQAAYSLRSQEQNGRDT